MDKMLYKYTTLESLALILKSKNLRLNSLINMDDLQEAQSSDEVNYGKFVFISSWMDQPQESIAMWKLYSNMYSGVRIGLKEYPFKKYIETADSIKKYFGKATVDGESAEFILPVEKCFNDKYVLLNFLYDKVLETVEYTDDESVIYPKLIKFTDTGFNMSTNKLGKYKNTYWEFQKEKRYILRFIPGDIDTINSSDNVADYIYNNFNKDFFSYFDLELDDEAYASMEITLSPQFTDGNRVLLNSLCEKYNPGIKIIDSKLKDRINVG